jgi:hypothetical protein
MLLRVINCPSTLLWTAFPDRPLNDMNTGKFEYRVIFNEFGATRNSAAERALLEGIFHMIESESPIQPGKCV